MKKVYFIIALVGIISLLSISFLVGGMENDPTALSNDQATILMNAKRESEEIKDSDKKEFTHINLDQYFEYIKEDNIKIVFLVKTDCNYSKVGAPIIQNIMHEYGLEVYYLNVDEFGDEGLTKFLASDRVWNDGIATPMLYLTRNNAIIDVVDGLTDKGHYLQFFRKHGFVI